MDIPSTETAALLIANKLFGKTADVISDDIASLYKIGRDKIIKSAQKKIQNINDGKHANMRVAREVFWSGSFTEDEVSAEYFGGILAASRSTDGKDDTGIYYVDIIKSLSSVQLHLHYVIYRSLHKIFTSNDSYENLNVGSNIDLRPIELYFSYDEITSLGIEFDLNLECLHRKGLVNQYKYGSVSQNNREFGYIMITPTALGIQLFCIANNRLTDFRNFQKEDFGDFQNISIPKIFENSLKNLTEKLQ